MSARSPDTALFISRLEDQSHHSNLAARLGKIAIAVTIVLIVVVTIVEALSKGYNKDDAVADDSGKLLLKSLLKISSGAVWSARNETMNLTMTTLRPN